MFRGKGVWDKEIWLIEGIARYRRLAYDKTRVIMDGYNSPKAMHQPGDKVRKGERLGTVVSHDARFVYYWNNPKPTWREFYYTVRYDDGKTLKYQWGLKKA